MSASFPRYFDDWQFRAWNCPDCGWAGVGNSLSVEYFGELFELHCPNCDYKFGKISHPSPAETRLAATAGNTEALAHLKSLDLVDTKMRAIRNARQAAFPDLDASDLTFTFSAEGGDWLSPAWLILNHAGTEIYREPSGYEGWEAIITISRKVLDRYPGRVAWIDPGEAGVNLLGDNISAAGGIDRFLQEQQIVPPDGRWSGH